MCSNNNDIEDFGNTASFNTNDISKKDIIYVNDFIESTKDVTSKESIEKINRELRRKYRINLSKNQIRKIYTQRLQDKYVNPIMGNWMIKRIMRKQSGVLVITVVLAPEWKPTKYRRGARFSCDKKCAYCPTETDLEGNPTQPKSYLSGEPAMRRATRHNFSVQGQINDRLDCYTTNGVISMEDLSNPKLNFKCEFILSGGTWEIYPKDYRESVIQEIYWACNVYGKKQREMDSMDNEIKINETARFRVIGMTIETRPDFINKYSLRDYRRYGVTRIQLGVQHYDDSILRKIKRGCYTDDTIKAIRLLKMVGLKVVCHLMPDLPGSNPTMDMKMFERAINDSDVQFDDVKIYPTAICKSDDPNLIVKSDIADWYRDGTYTPYSEVDITKLIEVLEYYLTNMNPWVRIQRLVRDIPTNEIEAGYGKKVNLRQLIDNKMKKEGKKCMDIRTMEIKDRVFPISHERTVVYPYMASEGMEYHIQMEAHDRPWYYDVNYLLFCMIAFFWSLFGYTMYYGGNRNTYMACYGFCRLRLDDNMGGNIIPVINNHAMIREVHVYGNSCSIGKKTKESQHRGFGKRMVKIAETISKNNGYNKIAIIAGVGTREYYSKKCGYHLPEDSTYMHKFI